MSPFWKPFLGLCGLGNLPSSALALGRKQAVLAAIALLTFLAPGCSVVHNGYSALSRNGSWNEAVVVMRNRSYSAKAWHRRKHHFCNEKYTQDFCNGFRAGYEAVCGGSDGCTPAFPPSSYWSWEYQSAEGQGKTSAWFSGYPHGVRAAEEEGTANWNQLQMSAGMQQQFQNSGMLNQESTMYSIPDQVMNEPAFGQPAIPGAVPGVPTPAMSNLPAVGPGPVPMTP